MKTIISAAIIAGAALFAALPASACVGGCDQRDTEVVRPEARQANEPARVTQDACTGGCDLKGQTIVKDDQSQSCSSCDYKGEPIVKDERPRGCSTCE